MTKEADCKSRRLEQRYGMMSESGSSRSKSSQELAIFANLTYAPTLKMYQYWEVLYLYLTEIIPFTVFVYSLLYTTAARDLGSKGDL